MSPESEEKKELPENEEILEQVEGIEGALSSELSDDERLQSGAPETVQDDVDFIQMSGLAHAEQEKEGKEAEEPPVAEEDDDPDAPVSFYEKGVKDVDESLSPADEQVFVQQEPVVETESSPAPVSEKISPVEAETEREKNSAPPSPVSTPEPASKWKQPDSLQEAEELLAELESQTRQAKTREDVSSFTLPEEETEEKPFALPVGENWSSEDGLDEDDSDPDVSLRRRHKSGKRRNLILLKTVALLVLLGFVGGGAYITYKWAALGVTATPEVLYQQARGAVEKKDYDSAARYFLKLARRFPQDPKGRTALFNAAFYFQLPPPGQHNLSERQYKQALELFEDFVKRYPDDVRVGRAKVFVGILHYLLGRQNTEEYRKAISQLRDPALSLEDPGSELAVLHTLAASYAALGDLDQARVLYLQAAGCTGNQYPEKDLENLSMLFQQMAKQASDPDERKKYNQQALDYLQQARECPELPPSERNRIEKRMRLLKEQLQLDKRETPQKPSISSSGVVFSSAVSSNGESTAQTSAVQPDVAEAGNGQTHNPIQAPVPVIIQDAEDIPKTSGKEQ